MSASPRSFSVECECCCALEGSGGDSAPGLLWLWRTLGLLLHRVPSHNPEGMKTAEERLSIPQCDMILMRVLPLTPRMKTPFFIFSLAETTTVPPDARAQLYTHAYKVCFRFVEGIYWEVKVIGVEKGCATEFLSSDVQVILNIIKQHIWGTSPICHSRCCRQRAR